MPTSESSPAGSDTAGSDTVSEPGVATLDYIRGLLLYRCGNAICHLPPPYTPPDFSKSGDEMFTLLTTFTVEKCGNLPLVTPGSLENSAIIQVVSGGCGTFSMPPDTYMGFTEAEFEMLSNWVAAGAPR